MDFINKNLNIKNNTAFLCFNSCNLDTNGLKNETELNIHAIIPNSDSTNSTPIFTINNPNTDIYIKFNDINIIDNTYNFILLTFVKDSSDKIYLTMIFKNDTDREIILKIPLNKTNNVGNNLDDFLNPIFNKSTSISDTKFKLNPNLFIPKKNSFYFTTIQSNVLIILFKNPIDINIDNYDKLLENIHTVTTSNNVLTTPLFYNEGTNTDSSQICTSSSNLINKIIKNKKEDKKEDKKVDKKVDTKVDTKVDKKIENLKEKKPEEDKSDEEYKNQMKKFQFQLLLFGLVFGFTSIMIILYRRTFDKPLTYIYHIKYKYSLYTYISIIIVYSIYIISYIVYIMLKVYPYKSDTDYSEYNKDGKIFTIVGYIICCISILINLIIFIWRKVRGGGQSGGFDNTTLANINNPEINLNSLGTNKLKKFIEKLYEKFKKL